MSLAIFPTVDRTTGGHPRLRGKLTGYRDAWEPVRRNATYQAAGELPRIPYFHALR